MEKIIFTKHSLTFVTNGGKADYPSFQVFQVVFSYFDKSE